MAFFAAGFVVWTLVEYLVHRYHHSPKGMEVGFGLTNGFWDVVWDTRIPEEERQALYGGMHGGHRRNGLPAGLRPAAAPASPTGSIALP